MCKDHTGDMDVKLAGRGLWLSRDRHLLCRGSSHDSTLIVAMQEYGPGVIRSSKFPGGSRNRDIYMKSLEF